MPHPDLLNFTPKTTIVVCVISFIISLCIIVVLRAPSADTRIIQKNATRQMNRRQKRKYKQAQMAGWPPDGTPPEQYDRDSHNASEES